MVIDPHKNKEQYLRWKQETANGIPDITSKNSALIRRYLADMEAGRNIGNGTRKGGRSYARLNTLRHRMTFLTREFERIGVPSLTGVTEEQVHDLFVAMRNGTIRKKGGGTYRSTGDYVKVFRAFWHWHMKVQRKQEMVVEDICVDLDDRTEKPPWVYLSQPDVQRLCEHAKHHYRVLLTFLFDTGIRSPTELVNVRVEDFSDGFTRLRIRNETSKAFGRTINLMLSAKLIREHIKNKRMRPEDHVFVIDQSVTNRYLKRLATRVLGDEKSPGGARYSSLTMYDLRHASACYWLPRYKNESALKYRFGWKRSAMIHYYTEFLGMKDTISHEDLHTTEEKAQIEQRLEQSDQEKRRLQEELDAMRTQINQILGAVSGLTEKVEGHPGRARKDAPPEHVYCSDTGADVVLP